MPSHEDAARSEVRAAMHARKIETAQLARETKLDPGTIADFLSGVRWPRVASLSKLENYFGWRPGYLADVASGLKPDGVSGASQDGGVLLDLDPTAFADLDEHERAEALAAAKLTYLQRAREIRQGRGKN